MPERLSIIDSVNTLREAAGWIKEMQPYIERLKRFIKDFEDIKSQLGLEDGTLVEVVKGTLRDGLDQSLSGVLDAVEAVRGLDERLDKIEKKLNSMDRRLSNLQKKINSIEKTLK